MLKYHSKQPLSVQRYQPYSVVGSPVAARTLGSLRYLPLNSVGPPEPRFGPYETSLEGFGRPCIRSIRPFRCSGAPSFMMSE